MGYLIRMGGWHFYRQYWTCSPAFPLGQPRAALIMGTWERVICIASGGLLASFVRLLHSFYEHIDQNV